MGAYGRNYVRGDDPMYRAVTPYTYTPQRFNWDTKEYEATGPEEHRVSYRGPYTTLGAAKRQRGPGGWVEVIREPAWERLEE